MQGSEATLEALEAAAEDLLAAVAAHRAVLRERGLEDLAALFDANARVERAVRAWDDRLLDHSGTSAVPLADAEEPPVADPAAGERLTVTSRFDLVVTDADALLGAGRAAHALAWPDDPEAEEAVTDAPRAVYALLQAADEPLLRLPGTEVVAGARSYVAPEAGQALDPDAPVAQPDGEAVLGESWS